MCAPNQQRYSLTAVLLTVLIAFQAAGWLLAWQGLLVGAKMEAQRTLLQEGTAFRQQIFHKDFIEKVKVGRKEIVLNGQLFDYKILSEQGDSLRISLLHDHKEEALFGVLGHVFKSEKGSRSDRSMPLTQWLAKWLCATFTLPQKPALPSEIALFLLNQNFDAPILKTQSTPGIFAPPPELVLRSANDVSV